LSPVIQCESDSESNSEESVGTATWGTVNKTPNLGKFTGNPGVKVFPSDPKEVFDVADLFFGDSFFDLLCQENNRYYLQNCEKYDKLQGVEVSGCHFSRNEKIVGDNHCNRANQRKSH
jgi:hypothetical protein